jgi:hypothetical protein
MINITIHNEDIHDAFVSAVDNQQPGTPSVFNQRLNHDQTSGQISVQEDGNGKFSITTTATDAGDPNRTKTEAQTGGAGDIVNVKCD